MAADREAQIRDRAYRLWQQDGETHGRDRDHWEQAERDVMGDTAAVDTDADAITPPIDADDAAAADTPPAPQPPVTAAAEPAPDKPVDVAAAAEPEPDTPVDTAPAPAPTKPAVKKTAPRRKRTG